MFKFLKNILAIVSLSFISLFANGIAFIGDSHFAGKILPNEIAKEMGADDFKIYAKIGRKADGVPEEVKKEIKNSDPEALVVMFGANDAASNVPAKKYAKEIKELSELSENEVFVLVPFYKKDQEAIDEYEKALKDLFRDQNNIKVISTRYCDLSYSKDDIHLTGKGYKDLGKCVAENMKGKSEPKLGSLTIQDSYNAPVKIAHNNLIRRKVYVVEIVK